MREIYELVNDVTVQALHEFVRCIQQIVDALYLHCIVAICLCIHRGNELKRREKNNEKKTNSLLNNALNLNGQSYDHSW